MKTLQAMKQALTNCWQGLLLKIGWDQSPLADITISGNGVGFYSIQGVTESGQEWVCSLVDGADANGLAYTDTSNFAHAIADGAIADGLSVSVNGQAYEVCA